MKTVFSLMLTAGLVFGMSSCSQENAADNSVNSETIASSTVSMSVEGMVCISGCAGKIEKTLNETSGIASCEVDFENGTATVDYDASKISEEEVIAAVASVNDGAYEVALMSNAPEAKSGKECSHSCTDAEKAACEKKCSPEEKAACERNGSSAETVSHEKECSPAEKKACEKKCAKDGVTKEA